MKPRRWSKRLRRIPRRVRVAPPFVPRSLEEVAEAFHNAQILIRLAREQLGVERPEDPELHTECDRRR